jgi:hypothetical protein
MTFHGRPSTAQRLVTVCTGVNLSSAGGDQSHWDAVASERR